MNLQRKTFIKKHIPFIFFIGLFILTTEKVFSQTTPDGTSPAVSGITTGRAQALVGAIIALISLIMGWRAKARSRSTHLTGNRQNKPTAAIIALSLGAIAIILSVVHLSTSAGAVFGSGSGKAGAIVALVLALTGATLSGLALRPKGK
ncbi:hypothetical protein QFZ48_005528 [Chitinophaga sp. W2I13]|uniref:DUF6223 family protein n=1 Tax=Chitinophaga sp. W2I13 TaxID=3373923 RepID=UPI003D2204C6